MTQDLWIAAVALGLGAVTLAGAARWLRRASRAPLVRQVARLEGDLAALQERARDLEIERRAVVSALGAASGSDLAAEARLLTDRLAEQEKTLGMRPDDRRGSSASGSFDRRSDGTQICTGDLAADAVGERLCAFPATFLDPPRVHVLPEGLVRVASVGESGFTYEVTAGHRVPGVLTFVAVGAWSR